MRSTAGVCLPPAYSPLTLGGVKLPIPAHADDPQPGRYRHFKGKDYLVLGVARHSESQEELVVYRPLYDDFGLWVRPRDLFMSSVDTPTGKVPRFSYVGPS